MYSIEFVFKQLTFCVAPEKCYNNYFVLKIKIKHTINRYWAFDSGEYSDGHLCILPPPAGSKRGREEMKGAL